MAVSIKFRSGNDVGRALGLEGDGGGRDFGGLATAIVRMGASSLGITTVIGAGIVVIAIQRGS
jgi:hypothetical protein